MPTQMRIVALAALLVASPAIADDAYYAIPLRELKVTEGELPARPQRPPEARPTVAPSPWTRPWTWSYATVQGEGEAYVGNVWSANMSPGPPRVSAWIDSQCVVVRGPKGREVTGRLFVPNVEGAGMAAVGFSVPAERASEEARLTFLRVKSEHYGRLAAMGIPGGAWFRYQAQQAQTEGRFVSEPAPATRRFPMPFQRRPANLAETYALFSGGRAVSENLQLDRVLSGTGGRSAVVPVDSISGVATREIDWRPLIEGLELESDPLAAWIPSDQYALFFPNVDAAVKIADLMSEGGTIFLRLAEPRVEDLRIIAKYEGQLGLSIRDAARLLEHVPVRSLAVTGSDLYFSQGTDVAVLLETPEPDRLATLLVAQIGLATVGDATAEWSQGRVGGLAFRGVRNADRTKSSYVARLPGAVVVTNSLYQLGRLASVKGGGSASIATLPEYTFFRSRYARNDPAESAFGLLGDATIRRLCGPRWRIGDSRRTRDAAVMMQLQAAHLDELVAGNVRGREIAADTRLSAPGSLTLTGSGVVSSTAGSLAFMTPIGELPLDRVTIEEARAYEQWRRGYERNWTWAFDPMALRLTLRDDEVAADLSVMPLILVTQYRPLVSITEGAEISPQAGDPHGALAHAILAINTQSELFGMGRRFASRTPFGPGVDPFGWIGKSVAVYADDDPFWKELAEVPPADRQKFLENEAWRVPVGVQVEVASGLKLIAFLTAVRTMVDQAAAGMTQWETRTYKDEPYTRVSLTERGRGGRQGLERAALYYAASGEALVVSTSEDVLKRAIDRQLLRREAGAKGTSATPPGKPWLGKSVGVQVDARLLEALVRFGHQEYQAIMQARAWGNIPVLNEWKRRYPGEDPIALNERLWQARLVCPGGGRYVWNDRWQTFESTVYGHPGEPKPGPGVPPALSAFASGNIGLTFADQGLRAQLALARPADASRATEAASEPAASEPAVEEKPAWTRLGEEDSEARKAAVVLRSDPADPEANLIVGKFLCVEKGDWQRGVPLVALGSDAGWKAAAEAELAGAATPEELIRTGNAWWNLAQTKTGPEKRACLLRAGAWYREADKSVSATGPEGKDLASRLKTIAETSGTIPALPARQSLPAVAMRLPPPPLRQNAAPADASTQNLRQLGLALHNHHDTFRTFPPAFRSDADGKPLLSWRVSILPFLGQQPLFEQFHLDEPWDSEHNKRLIAQMPAVFRSPLSRAEPGKTNYLGVAGQRGIFPGKDGVRIADIRDGTSNTIAVVEVDDAAAVEWTRPDDFDPSVADLAGKLGGLRSGQFLVLFADGSVSMISGGAARPALNALFTRDGREPVGEAGWPTAAPMREVVPEPAVEAPPEKAVEQAKRRHQDAGNERFRDEIRKLRGEFVAKGFKASWSPDGKRLAFGRQETSSRHQGAGVAILEVGSLKTIDLTDSGKDPAWSPGDGRWIAYVTGYGREEQVWLIEPSGAGRRKVADGGFPSWSADGKTLYFHSRTQGAMMSLSMGSDGPVGEPSLVFRTACWYPVVSPDGTQIAHTIGRRMIVADRESGRTVRTWDLPNPRGFLFAWSPDGKQIGVGGYGQPDVTGLSLLIVENGAMARALSGPVTMPAWSPDGSKLAIDLRLDSGYEIWLLEARRLAGVSAAPPQPDRYAVPEGGVAELAKFIDELRRIRPASRSEASEYAARGRPALKQAAERLIQLEKDTTSLPYQTAVFVLLEDRLRGLSSSDPQQQRQMVEFVRMYLVSEPEIGLTRDAARLAMGVARGLETRQPELAAEAYETFAKLIAKRSDEQLSEQAKKMEGAARRLKLVGNEMQLEGAKLDGTPLDWGAYRGKVVLVDFWTTWCPYCWPEIANTKKQYDLYHDRGFDVVAVNLDEDRQKVEEFLKKQPVPWVVLHADGAGWNHPMATYYGVSAVPTMFLVDQQGKVASIRARGRELDRLLAALLGPVESESRGEPADRLAALSLEMLKSAELSSNRINGSDNGANQLAEGTILAARTNQGRYSKFLIQEYGYNLVISWVTYDEDGAVHSQGSDLRVRGTWSCDLDRGLEAGEGADFWWEQVDPTERYLVPKNGARVAVVAKPSPKPPGEQ